MGGAPCNRRGLHGLFVGGSVSASRLSSARILLLTRPISHRLPCHVSSRSLLIAASNESPWPLSLCSLADDLNLAPPGGGQEAAEGGYWRTVLGSGRQPPPSAQQGPPLGSTATGGGLPATSAPVHASGSVMAGARGAGGGARRPHAVCCSLCTPILLLCLRTWRVVSLRDSTTWCSPPVGTSN